MEGRNFEGANRVKWDWVNKVMTSESEGEDPWDTLKQQKQLLKPPCFHLFQNMKKKTGSVQDVQDLLTDGIGP